MRGAVTWRHVTFQALARCGSIRGGIKLCRGGDRKSSRVPIPFRGRAKSYDPARIVPVIECR
eukprot:1388740-Rhodomonas_salina.1